MQLLLFDELATLHMACNANDPSNLHYQPAETYEMAYTRLSAVITYVYGCRSVGRGKWFR